MADNVVFQTSVTATPPNATSVATDDVGGVQYQRVKLDIGADGATSPVTLLNPMPIGTLSGGTVIVSGTVQALGSVQGVGTFQVLGSVQGVGTFQILGTLQPLAGSVHIANTISGTVQVHGTAQVLGTTQPLAGSVHLASNLPGGSINAQGVVAHGAAAAGNPLLWGGFGSSGTQAAVDDGDLTRLWTDLNGRLQVRGTIDSMPTVTGTVQTHGTSQVLGTMQPLAGSVHVANTISGTVQTHGTSQVIGTVQTHGTSQVLGSVQTVGTSQVLGTIQPLAGSVHLASNLPGGSINAQGVVAHDSPVAGNPLLFAAFGSSGTQAAVSDGDVVRLWADLNGRLQIRGTIDSMPAINVAQGTIPGGTIQIHGTAQVLGTVRALTEVTVTVGTIAEGTINNFTGTIGGGTFQPLLGTSVTIGSVAHGAAADARPVMIAAFGSSGTQAAVDDGDVVRLWADLNGRLQTSALGTFQPLAGSVHVANTAAVVGSVSAQGYVANGAAAAGNPILFGGFGSSGTQAAVDDGDVVRAWFDLNGRQIVRGTIDSLPNVTIGAALPAGDNNIGNVDVVTMPTVTVTGTVQTHGTSQVLGTVQTHGTSQALGTFQPLAGSVHVANAISGTVRTRPALSSEGFFGTRFTGAVTNGTLVPGPAQGTYVRLWGVIVSGSAAGTSFIELGDGTVWGATFLAANGGFVYTSAKGIRTNGTSQDVLFTCAAGTWGVSVEYTLEN